MDMFNSMEPCCDVKPSQCNSPSLLDTLRRKQAELSMRLSETTQAIEALEKSPEIARVLELVARAR